MTLRRAVALFPRPWMNGDVTFQDWLLACAVIEQAIGEHEALSPAAREAPSSGSVSLVSDGEHREHGDAVPWSPEANK